MITINVTATERKHRPLNKLSRRSLRVSKKRMDRFARLGGIGGDSVFVAMVD